MVKNLVVGLISELSDILVELDWLQAENERLHERFKIHVRNGDGSIVETIHRVVWCEQIGNFAPVFCRYKGKRCLVESDELHLDDSLRCNKDDHIGKLFIRPRDKNGRVVATWDLT